MNKSQLIRYIVRLLATVLNIWSCVAFTFISAVYLSMYFLITIKVVSSPHKLFLIFWGGGGTLFFLGWTLICMLFAMLFIRSLFATTENRYPQKLFGNLAKGIAWCFVLSTLGFTSQITLHIMKGLDEVVVLIYLYLVGLGGGLLMLIPALQFWRPSVLKTWVLNALPLLLYIPALLLKKEYADLSLERIMQLLF